ncbi:plastocyanin/azurin family copper-binding protein [Halobacterium sp. KA-4]|uniref:plastocyanin/azurin family copper-binding protein n=1 Tax=Halobacterium sp. KA-4 TaxID=2896367 RepID=UPI001E442E04|nr:plastocyanin/azurin family copper-binding protein [Halobacterium sp. KA-4]MCD2200398.1 plastocyanin/azurin family copper-binding protein [Halobacterium sp. KA-4]
MNSDADERVTRRSFLRAGAGAAAAGVAATGTAAAQEGEGGPTVVTVAPGGSLTFDPETAYVQPGGTVRWEWAAGGHNVVPTSIPEEASWEGHESLEDSGFTYEHTFEVEGTYEYVCTPHAGAGMEGVIEVTENPPEQTGYQSILPDSAKTLGVAATGSMVSVLGLTYLFMRYGGDYEGDFEE